MTNHKNAKRARNYTKAALASALAATILAGSAGLASAADPTETANLTQAEYQGLLPEINAASGQMTGSITEISIPDAAAAQKLKDQGINIDFPKSVEASNTRNAADPGFPVAVLSVTTDEATFKANSPYASKIDLAGGREGFDKGLNLALGDSTHHAVNFQNKADAKVPNLPVGEIVNPWVLLTKQTGNAQLPADTYQLSHVFPSSSYTDGGAPNDLMGNTDSEHSPYMQSWIVDSFAGSAQREADLTLDGAQRGFFASGLSSCVTAVQSSCGVWITPTASGLVTIDEAGNQIEATVAIGESVWVEIKSTLAAQAPVHTESNPFVAASGDKVYFAPINEGANTFDGTGAYNLLNPSVALKPWEFSDETELPAGWNRPSLEWLQAKYADGKFYIPVQVDSPFLAESFTANQTFGENPDERIITLTSTNDGLADTWNYNGSTLFDGQTIVINGTDGVGGTDLIATATVVEASKGKLVLSMVLSKPETTFPFTAATIGTSTGTYPRANVMQLAPAYEMKVIKADTPTPDLTIIPEEPKPEETPTPDLSIIPETPDSTTNEEIIPDEALTDGSETDDLAETSATASKLADTGSNGNIALWSLAGLFGLATGALALMAARLKGQRPAKQ